MVVVWPHCNSLSLACCSARSVATFLNLPARFDADEGNGGEGVSRPPGGFSCTLCTLVCYFVSYNLCVSWNSLDVHFDVNPCFENIVEAVKNPNG